jgi:hypothetical protein
LAPFNGSLESGSIGLNGFDVTEVKLKKRKYGDLIWEDLDTIEYNDTLTSYLFYDKYVQATEIFEYGLVPVAGAYEGASPISSSIQVEFNHDFIFDKDVSHKLFENVEIGSIESVQPSTMFDTLGDDKYPYVSYQGNKDYNRLSISSAVVSSPGATVDGIDLRTERIYRDSLVSWLKNKKPKIYKTKDGWYLLVNVVDNPGLTSVQGIPGSYTLNCNIVEVGDAHSKETLTNMGLV